MTDLIATAKDLIEKAERATPGTPKAYDNYILIESLDGERGKVLAEFFAGNPMQGDNCNDTAFYAECCPTTITALCKLLLEYHEALEHTDKFCLCSRLTKGFDYSEKHPRQGKPGIGKRWLTPRDVVKDAIGAGRKGEGG